MFTRILKSTIEQKLFSGKAIIVTGARQVGFSILTLAFLLLGCSSQGRVVDNGGLEAGYKSPSGRQATTQKDWQCYRVDSVDGERRFIIFDNYFGKEQTAQFTILSVVAKRSLICCKALIDADTVVLVDLKSGCKPQYEEGRSHDLTIRRITRWKIPYPSLPLMAFTFENDTLWRETNDKRPWYLRVNNQMQFEHRQIDETKLNSVSLQQ